MVSIRSIPLPWSDDDGAIEALLSLYRYYEYAEVMRYEWHRYFHMGTERRHSVDTPFPAPPDPNTCGLSAFSIHWFAALYPLVEGWQHLGLRDEEIDDLMQQAGT